MCENRICTKNGNDVIVIASEREVCVCVCLVDGRKLFSIFLRELRISRACYVSSVYVPIANQFTFSELCESSVCSVIALIAHHFQNIIVRWYFLHFFHLRLLLVLRKYSRWVYDVDPFVGSYHVMYGINTTTAMSINRHVGVASVIKLT